MESFKSIAIKKVSWKELISIPKAIIIYILFIFIGVYLEMNNIVDENSFIYNYFFGILGNIILVCLAVYFIKKYITELKTLFLFKSQFNNYIFILSAIAIGILLNVLSTYIDSFFSSVFPSFGIESYYQSIKAQLNNWEYRMLFIIGSGIISGFSEEFFFRGFCYNILRKNMNIVFAIIMNIIIFILFHPVPAFFVSYILINIVICIFYEYTKSLIIPIAIHIAYNTTSLLLM